MEFPVNTQEMDFSEFGLIDYSKRLVSLTPRYQSSEEARKKLLYNPEVSDLISADPDQVRTDLLEVLRNEDQSRGFLAQYGSLGLTFLPVTVAEAGGIKVKEEFPTGCYGRKEIHIGNTKTTRKEILRNLWQDGDILMSEGIKIHEIAHCFNAEGYTVPDNQSGLDRIKILLSQIRHPYPRDLFATVTAEQHSMFAHFWLTAGFNFDREGKGLQAKFGDVSSLALSHPHVGGLVTGKDINHMVKFVSEVSKNFLRMLAMGMTLGQIGTYVVVNMNSISSFKDGHFSEWEARIRDLGINKGLIKANMSNGETTIKVDSLVKHIEDMIEYQTKLVRYSMTTAVTNKIK